MLNDLLNEWVNGKFCLKSPYIYWNQLIEATFHGKQFNQTVTYICTPNFSVK